MSIPNIGVWGYEATDPELTAGEISGTVGIQDWSPPDHLLMDEFRRTSTTTIGVAETVPAIVNTESGVWGTDGQNAYLASHGTATYDGLSWAVANPDVVVRSSMIFLATPNAGLKVRSLDADNFLGVKFTGTAVDIVKVDAGVQSVLATANITTVASGTHLVDICADLDSLSVWVDKVPVVAYKMSAAEVLKFRLAASHGIWSTGTAEGTKWERVEIIPITMRGLYNGRTTGSTQRIGRVSSANGKDWYKLPSPVAIQQGAGFEATQVAEPCFLFANDIWYMYYAGLGGGVWKIGLKTSTDGGITWTSAPNNPIVTIGGASDWDSTNVQWPVVVYDPTDTDIGQRFKMWFQGDPGGGLNTAIGYAYSADGINWTKWSGNPVMRAGQVTNDYDFTAVFPGTVFKVGTQWTMLYESRLQNSNEGICAAHFTDPKSKYMKDFANPLLGPRRTATRPLTADATNASPILAVDTTPFSQGEPVLLVATGPTTLVSRVLTIDSQSQLTLTDNVNAATFTTANAAYLRSIFWGGLLPRSIIRVAGQRYRIFMTPFREVVSPLETHEFSAAIEASTPIGPMEFSMGQGLLYPPGAVSTFDTLSAENPSIVVL